MLQNPSKYHPNPLSHFLALHSTTQAANNVRNNCNVNGITNASHILTNVSAFNLGGGVVGSGGVGVDHRHHGAFQQQSQQHTLLAVQKQQINDQIHTSNQHNLSTTTHAHQQHTQFLDATGTTLDVGKSFTIAAILGLQNRNGMEHNHRHSKDYDSVINLSLNGGSDNGNVNANLSSDEINNKICDDNIASKHENSNESEDRNINRQNTASDKNKYHCDNNNSLVNAYLPISTTPSTTVNNNVFMKSATQHAHLQQLHHHHQQQQQQQQHHHQHSSHHHHQHQPLMSTHVRANNFATVAAVAAVSAVVNGAPTALQSLQQLHQHHSQQTTLNFSREKLKSDNHTKKASLKNKRVRTIFTPEQLERLEAEFERQQYMVGPERLYLAHTLQLTEAQVKVWFQNRRIKWRKHHLELTQQRLALLRQNQMPTPNVSAGLGPIPSPEGLIAAASNSSFDENEDLNNKNEEVRGINSQKSQTESDSELSVCNDSMDSINDGGGDT